MKKAALWILVSAIVCCAEVSFGAEPRFVKLSDHCYFLQSQDSGANVAAVITDDGVLMINPPPEPDLTAAAAALAKVSPKAVRWIVFTEPGLVRNANAPLWAERNPFILTSMRMEALVRPESERSAAVPGKTPALSRLVFENQMRLFPLGLEIRIIALQHKARTGGDIVVFVPAEKILFVGGLYEAARFPDIDAAAGGNALEWFDGMKQVVDAVPVLKTAIPAAKPSPKSEPEKTLEEGILILSMFGEPSNLQNLKDLLESARKLRTDLMRAVKAGRTCDRFLASSAADLYRAYGNLDSFAGGLCETLK
jgi:glyoxylase-like metal-dependent hydrolase (beta-lactamase superfamily II)